MNQTWEHADRLCQRREATTGQPCYVVPMGAWLTAPLAALQRAEAGRFGGIAEQ